MDDKSLDVEHPQLLSELAVEDAQYRTKLQYLKINEANCHE